MNLFAKLYEFIDDHEGEGHIQFTIALIRSLYNYLESDYLFDNEARDGAIDELIEFLQEQKTKPEGK